MKERIRQIISENIRLKQELLSDELLLSRLAEVSEMLIAAFRADQKVLFCGNGGSAADAQHLAAELSGRFYLEREPLFAEALHVNSSHLTAVANDYSFDEVFARLVRAKGRKGDVLLGLSTSGNSENIVRAVLKGNEMGLTTIALTGQSGGKLEGFAQVLIKVPSTDTPRIQECHILIGHIICELVEHAIFS